MKAKSYRDLEIYQLSYKLAMKIHRISMKLPKHGLYEEGGQIRKSSKGVSSTIVEGYGRRKYKVEVINSLIVHIYLYLKKNNNAQTTFNEQPATSNQ